MGFPVFKFWVRFYSIGFYICIISIDIISYHIISIDIIATVKLFADDISPFSIIHDAKTTAYELNKDLQKTAEWAHQWKMSFNPDLNKQTKEFIFSR